MITVDKPQKIIAEKGCCTRRAAGKRKNGKLTRRVVEKVNATWMTTPPSLWRYRFPLAAGLNIGSQSGNYCAC